MVLAAGQDSNTNNNPLWSGNISAVSPAAGNSQLVGSFTPNVNGGSVRIQLGPGSSGYLSLAEVEVEGTLVTGGSAPTITSFTSDSASITSGGSTSLRWNITGATSASIDNGVGSVSPTGGSVSVKPTQTTTYHLIATNSSGPSTATVQVIVQPSTGNAPTIVSFTASPATIVAGATATLQWNITSCTVADNCGGVTANIDGIGPVNLIGSVTVHPAQTTTYRLTASNAIGSVSATTQLTVNPAPVPKPVIDIFTAVPDTIIKGQSAQLNWHASSNNGLAVCPNPSCIVSIDNGVGNPQTLSVSVSPSQTTTYTITAQNDSGAATKSATVTVTNITAMAASGLSRTWSGTYSYAGGRCNWTSGGKLSVSIGPLTPQSNVISGMASITGVQYRDLGDCSIKGVDDGTAGTLSGTVTQDPKSLIINVIGTLTFELPDGQATINFAATAGGPGLNSGPLLGSYPIIQGTLTVERSASDGNSVGSFKLQ
jgi:hypothetical protein